MQLPNPFVWSRGTRAVRRTVCVSLAALMTAGGIVALSGCGADSDDNDPYAYVSSTAAPYTGRDYTARITLADGTSGTVIARVLPDGTAQGTFSPDATSSTRGAKSRVEINTPFVSGTFNPQTGAINLSGTYTVNGQTFTIRITGTLPVPPSLSGGSLTCSINGENFSTSWTVSFGNPTASPSPTVSPSPSVSPSPTVSPTPTPTPTPTPIPSNATGDGDVFFFNPSGTPAGFDTSDIRTSNGTARATVRRLSDSTVSVTITEVKNGKERTVTLTLNALRTIGIVQAGNFSILDTGGNGLAANAKGIANVGLGVTDVATGIAQYYLATSGNVVLERIDNNHIKLYFENIGMEANTGTANNGQSGIFRSSGVVDLVFQ